MSLFYLSSCQWLQSCEPETGFSTHGESPDELIDNAVPRMSITCPF